MKKCVLGPVESAQVESDKSLEALKAARNLVRAKSEHHLSFLLNIESAIGMHSCEDQPWLSSDCGIYAVEKGGMHA